MLVTSILSFLSSIEAQWRRALQVYVNSRRYWLAANA
jgi:hypothetical protein